MAKKLNITVMYYLEILKVDFAFPTGRFICVPSFAATILLQCPKQLLSQNPFSSARPSRRRVILKSGWTGPPL